MEKFPYAKIMFKRWYDADPVVSRAVNIFEKNDCVSKNYLAELIIKEAIDKGVVINEDNFDCFWQRRQNDNAKFQKAVEYLKNSDIETAREISFKIIEYHNNHNNQNNKQ